MFFEQNLLALKNKYPALAAELEQILATGEIVPAKSGYPTLKATRDGKTYYLHSAYDPIREAARWAQEVYAEEDDILLVCGIGLGYHLQRLSLLYPKANIIALEPDLKTFKTALKAVDFTFLINKENMFFYFGTDKREISALIEKYLNIYQPEKIKLLAYLPVARKATPVFQELENAVNYVVIDHILNSNTVMRFAFDWLENFLVNLPEILQAPDVNVLCGPLKGIPGVIVAAGPSLDKNIHLLSEVKNKAVVIAVGTAFKAVLSLGLEPDLVVSADGGEPNGANFKDVKVNEAGLVFAPEIYKSIPVNFPGPKIVGAYNPYFLTWLDNYTKEKRTFLKGGPSVANISFDLAVKMGLNPIIFIGQDLAYAEGKTHSQRTIYEGRSVSPHEQLVEVEGFGGGKKVTTSLPLACFLHWFENEIPLVKEQVKIINATEGGARITGTEEMTFREAISLYIKEVYPIDKTIKELAVKKVLPPELAKKIIFDLKEIRKNLHRVKKYAWYCWRLSQKLASLYATEELPSLEEINPLKSKLKQVDQKIYAQQKAFPWLESVFSPAYQKLARLEAEEAVEFIEKSRKITVLSCTFYQELKEAAGKIEEWMNTAVKMIK